VGEAANAQGRTTGDIEDSRPGAHKHFTISSPVIVAMSKMKCSSFTSCRRQDVNRYWAMVARLRVVESGVLPVARNVLSHASKAYAGPDTVN
jgi:hypothetical protein